MNFYKRHIGDISKACAHLSQGQMGAYDLLLDWLYGNEKPIPLSQDAIYRIARASSKAEKLNADAVIDEFFERTDDGYIQKRATIEIAKANERAETNRRIAEQREAKKRARREHESCSNREPSQTPDTRHHDVPQTPFGAEPPKPAGSPNDRSSSSEQPTLRVVPSALTDPGQPKPRPEPDEAAVAPADPNAFAEAVSRIYGEVYGLTPPPVPLMLRMQLANRWTFHAAAGQLSWWRDYFEACWADTFLTDRAHVGAPLGPRSASFKHLVSEDCMAGMIERSRREVSHG